MIDISDKIHLYREHVRHLWNLGFRQYAEPTQDWEVRDNFDTIAKSLFNALVLYPLGASELDLAPASCGTPPPVPGLFVVARGAGISIFINREMTRSGYWDHPINALRAEEATLQVMRFFDFGQLGWRDFRYFEVMITASRTCPEIVGRVALVDVDHVRVEFDPAVIDKAR